MREPDAASVAAECGDERGGPLVDLDGPPARLYDFGREEMVAYLRERRRAIITELRKIEQMLGMEESIAERRRPH
jgi:hypothetical protein